MATGNNLILNLLKNSIEKVEKNQLESSKKTVNVIDSKKKPSKVKTMKKKPKAERTEEIKPEKKKKKVVDSKPLKDKPKEDVPIESEPTWNLTKDRLVKIRKFKGKTYVDIREYYVDKLSWEIKPGIIRI